MPGYASYRNFESSRRYVGLAWAVGIHALLLVLMVSGLFKTSFERILKKPLEAVVLQEVIVPPPPPPPPPPPVPTPKPIVNEPKPSAPVMDKPLPAPPNLAPAPMEAPAKAEHVPEPAPAPVAMAPQQHAIVAAAPIEPPRKSNNTASAEAEYAARLNAMLNANKRYPTGRQASQERPKGVVKLWFTLNRVGNLLEVGLLEPANSNLLNDAAISTVRRASYPPFSPELWPGQDQHKFTVDIDFLPPA